ncbi:cyclic nucleotide-binding/CBS domain-containing protein [Candidatus Manganitrophus noduliformans]|nr:CBS domain-containing protein [Candidatus Manganitrophus noduliformans]
MIPRVPVERVMCEKLLTLDQTESALRAAGVMTEHGIGSVLVSRDGEIIGIVTESDLVRKVLGQGIDPKGVKLETIMSYPPITIDVKGMLEQAYKLMGENQIRHFVVTREGAPCGIVSARSFMESIYP